METMTGRTRRARRTRSPSRGALAVPREDPGTKGPAGTGGFRRRPGRTLCGGCSLCFGGPRSGRGTRPRGPRAPRWSPSLPGIGARGRTVSRPDTHSGPDTRHPRTRPALETGPCRHVKTRSHGCRRALAPWGWRPRGRDQCRLETRRGKARGPGRDGGRGAGARNVDLHPEPGTASDRGGAGEVTAGTQPRRGGVRGGGGGAAPSAPLARLLWGKKGEASSGPQ